jgi:hypothetical protein
MLILYKTEPKNATCCQFCLVGIEKFYFKIGFTEYTEEKNAGFQPKSIFCTTKKIKVLSNASVSQSKKKIKG